MRGMGWLDMFEGEENMSIIRIIQDYLLSLIVLELGWSFKCYYEI